MRSIMLRFVIYLGCVGASCWVACVAAPDQASNGDTIAYRAYTDQLATVDRLSAEFVASESYQDFEPFVESANEGARHMDYCPRFLSEQGHSAKQRRIAIWSMYQPGVHEYVLFLRKLAELYDRGVVSSDELHWGVSQRFSVVILESYAESDVQSVLKEIAARTGIPPKMKSGIESILSGKAIEDLRAFRRDCCSGPK